jgi:hypothetical protein
MKWEDVSVDGEWRIPTEEREKGTAGSLVLPRAAIDIIREQPRFPDNPYVLAGRMAGTSKACPSAKLSSTPRRKSLLGSSMIMSRAGVRPDIAERVMGHAIRCVEGIHERHCYRDKAEALKRLVRDLVAPSGCRACPRVSRRGAPPRFCLFSGQPLHRESHRISCVGSPNCGSGASALQ